MEAITATADIGRSTAVTSMAETASTATHTTGIPPLISLVRAAGCVDRGRSLVSCFKVWWRVVTDGSFSLQLRDDVAATLIDKVKIDLFCRRERDVISLRMVMDGPRWGSYSAPVHASPPSPAGTPSKGMGARYAGRSIFSSRA
jgi:hypothetical protein